MMRRRTFNVSRVLVLNNPPASPVTVMVIEDEVDVTVG